MCAQVFRQPFLKLPVSEGLEVQTIFNNLSDLYELSVQVLSSLEECVEMAGQMKGEESCPHSGYLFEELGEVSQQARSLFHQPSSHRMKSLMSTSITQKTTCLLF